VFLDIEVYPTAAGSGVFVAACRDLQLFSYGPSAAKAIQRLEAVIRFYVTEAPECGITQEKIMALGAAHGKNPDYFIPGRSQAGFLN